MTSPKSEQSSSPSYEPTDEELEEALARLRPFLVGLTIRETLITAACLLQVAAIVRNQSLEEMIEAATWLAQTFQIKVTDVLH